MFRFFSKYKKYLFVCASLIIIAAIYFCFNILSGKAVDSGDRIHFVSSEEGDGIIVESNGHCGLIDSLDPASYKSVANSNTCALEDTGTSSLGNGSTLKTYAENIGCDHFDFVIMTHSHKDHIGGIPLLKDMFNEDTIVFYKEDLTTSDDYEENKDCGTYKNHEYQQRALATFNEKNSQLCDVTTAYELSNSKCNLSQLSNNVISGVGYNSNNDFINTHFIDGTIGYNTNVRNTLYFDFGDFKINLYSLYNLSYHQEDLNSILTLIYHKPGQGRAALTADLSIEPIDELNDNISSLSGIIHNPTGTCYECISRGVENQLADVVRSVDVLKAANHGLENSNTLHALDVYQPDYYITTGGNLNSNLYQSNIAAITYLKNKYHTKSYLSNQATGAVVAQFNGTGSDKVSILNYDANGTQSNTELADVSTIVYKDLNDNYLDGKKIINENYTYDNQYVYIKNGRPIVNDWITVDDKIYHAKSTGLLDLGFSDPINDNIFYFSDLGDEHDGEMLTGLNVVQYGEVDYLYYFRTEPDIENSKPIGTYVTGLKTINNKTYYFITDEDIENDKFEGPVGSAITGFAELDGYNYYFYDGESGDNQYSMAKNTYVLDDSGDEPIKYYADSNGHLTPTEEKVAFIPTSNSCQNAIYNGDEFTLAEDGDGYSVSNNTATNADTYTITASLLPGYKWNDNSTTNKTFECSISKSESSFTRSDYLESVEVGYTGQLMKLVSEIPGRYVFTSDVNYIEIKTLPTSAEANEEVSLNIKAVKSGISYVDITFIPNDTDNYEETTSRETVVIGDNSTIAVIPTAAKYCKSGIAYNGEEQVLTNNPGTGYTFTDNTGTYSADYTITAVLNEGYTWEDGTTEDKTFECKLDAYTPVITITNVDIDAYVGVSHTLMTVSSDVAGTFTYTASSNISLENTVDIVQPGLTRNIVITGNEEGYSYVNVHFEPDGTDINTTDNTQYFNVRYQTLPYPTSENLCNKNLVYNGSPQTLASSDSPYITLINNTGTNANEYTVTARINQSGISWPDETTTDKTFKCSIAKATPSIYRTNELTEVPLGYSGPLVVVSSDTAGRFLINADGEHIELTNSFIDVSAGQSVGININAIKAGSSNVQINFLPTDSTNYDWLNTSFAINVNVTDNTLTATIPTANEYCKSDLVYNGEAQTLTNEHGTGYTFSNNTATNADEYNVTASLNSGYEWSDGTTIDKTFVCSISKANPKIETINITGELPEGYSGSLITMSANVAGRYVFTADGEHIEVTNPIVDAAKDEVVDLNINAIKEGTSVVTFSFVPTDTTNYNSYQTNWNITVGYGPTVPVATIPTAKNYCISDLVYNGTEQTLTSTHGIGYTFTNNTATNAGDYNVTATLNSGYEWSDGSTEDKYITCSIAKYTPVITRSNEVNEVTIGSGHTRIVTLGSDVPGVFRVQGDEYASYYNENVFVTPTVPADIEVIGSKAGNSTITITFTPDNGANVDTYEIVKNITVNKEQVAIPTNANCNSLVYNGENQALYNLDSTKYGVINNTGRHAGDYTVTASLIDSDTTMWSDGTITDKTVTCSIAKADPNVIVDAINLSNIKQYSNTEILSFTPNVSGIFRFTSGHTIIRDYEEEIAANANQTITFSAMGFNPGTTTLNVTFTPNGNDYNSYTRSFSISVVQNEEHVVSVPTADNVCLKNAIYNGSEQTLTVSDSDAYEFINNKGTDAGSYDVTIRLKGDYKWSDTTTTDKTVSCSIKKADLAEPTITGYSGTYDGNPHTITASSVVGGSIRYSLDNSSWSENAPSITDAGTTQVYVKYIGDSNHNDSSVYSTNIIIDKANPVLSTLNLSPHLDEGATVEAGPISSNVAGTITLTSSDTSKLIVPTVPAVVGANEQVKFNITGVKDGEASYTITFIPQSSNYNQKVITANIIVNRPLLPPVTIPTAESHCKANLKYTGSAITLTNDPATGYTFTNNVQTNVGTYTVTAKLDENYYWEDNTTTDKTFNCSIIQADSYLNLNSKLVQNNGYIIAKVNPPITYTNFKALIDTNGVITHSKTDAQNVATCDTLSINLGGVIQNYTLVIPGDITKNGLAEKADVTLLFNYLRNKTSLNTCQLKASDTTNDDSIHINDVAKLYQFVNGKIEGLGE
ncbi:MAG: MBL fold metallo-hydrolase [Bacilli bacterium]|nr:MBL fold metallo-hydrolase [Bacilli bacterium]